MELLGSQRSWRPRRGTLLFRQWLATLLLRSW